MLKLFIRYLINLVSIKVFGLDFGQVKEAAGCIDKQLTTEL